jgi:hypothetical protein
VYVDVDANHKDIPFIRVSDGEMHEVLLVVKDESSHYWTTSPMSIGCPRSGGRLFCFASPGSLTALI